MARVSDGVLPDGSQLGLTLDRYQEIVGLNLCAFNGINRPTDNHDTSCIDIVGQSQRDQLAIYLLQAEQVREEELGYHVWPKYVWYEEHDVSWGNPFILTMKYLINIGCPTYTIISAGVALDLGTPNDNLNDPVVISVSTTATKNEIVVTYPGELVRIKPSNVAMLSGGVVRISIPRCRLVKPEYNDDRDDPPSYYDNDVFLETVDVYRYSSDVSEGARFVWRQVPCDVDCEPNTQPACPIITGKMAYDLSIVDFYPATYSGGAWTTGCLNYRSSPTSIQVTYLSGKYNLSNQIYTLRLSHTLMPRPPCSCDIVKQKWEDDRKIPDRGGWSPYGNMNGALHCWMADSRAMAGHGGMFPRIGGLG